MAGEKTEKATPKRRSEAREKGQVARSSDLNGAIVMLAGLFALAVAGSGIAARMGDAMRRSLEQVAAPSVVDRSSIGKLLLGAMGQVGLAIAPVAVACAVAGVVVSVAQVGFKPSVKALKPDPKRINPLSNAKQIFGKNAIFEAAKAVTKVSLVGAFVALALLPQLTRLGSMVGIAPPELAGHLTHMISGVALRAGLAYLLVGVIDYGYQRHTHEKNLKMDFEEVKQEHKEQNVSAEVRQAIRRRQHAASRSRMFADIPTADVIVTNPTHYAVALRYDSGQPAPIVVAKGKGHIAARIREMAAEHDIMLYPDPPLARGLYAAVDVGRQIPEEFFGAVAAVLAFVYRAAGRRRAA